MKKSLFHRLNQLNYIYLLPQKDLIHVSNISYINYTQYLTYCVLPQCHSAFITTTLILKWNCLQIAAIATLKRQSLFHSALSLSCPSGGFVILNVSSLDLMHVKLPVYSNFKFNLNWKITPIDRHTTTSNNTFFVCELPSLGLSPRRLKFCPKNLILGHQTTKEFCKWYLENNDSLIGCDFLSLCHKGLTDAVLQRWPDVASSFSSGFSDLCWRPLKSA